MVFVVSYTNPGWLFMCILFIPLHENWQCLFSQAGDPTVVTSCILQIIPTAWLLLNRERY